MSYGLLGSQKALEDQSIQGLQETARIQQSNKMAEDQMKQAKKQQQMSGIGAGAGIGMMAGGPVGAAIGAGVGFLASSIF